MHPQDDSGPDMIPRKPRRRRPVRSVAVAGVAIVALAGGAGIGYTATHSLAAKGATDTAAAAAATPSPSMSHHPKSSWSPTHTMRADRMGPGFGGVLHGRVTVPKAGGGYQTLDFQNGTVTKVSMASVTVKSADGFTATYTVTGQTIVGAQAAGIGSVRDGNTVFVLATAGTPPTAASIFDITAIKASHAAFGFPVHPAMPGQAPAPST
jgi:hypothetical protein